MRETYGSRLKLNKIAISFLLAAILLLPVLPTGSGTDGEGMTAEGEEMTDSLFGTVDLSTEIMEQYIKGENEEDYLGYSIDKADLNLDGKDDLILGAPGYNLSSGAVLIFFGGSKQRIMDYDSADVMIDHNEIGSYFGLKVKTGDVNSDGLPDVVVSGYQDTDLTMEVRNVYPKAFLFLGREKWPSHLTSRDADTVYVGSTPKDLFGWGLEVGDVNGDGYDDVLITEMEQWGSEASSGGSSGKSYEFFLQPGSEGKDSQVYINSPSSNYGTYTYLMTNYGTTTRGFVEFDLSEVKPSIVVEDAMISFYHRYNTNSGKIELRIVEEPWEEMGITWNNQPKVSKDRVAFQTLNQAGAWMDFKDERINKMIEDWVNGKIPNYGIRISGEDGNYNNAYFESSDTSNPPKIWFKYHKRTAGGMNGTIYMFDGGDLQQSERNVSMGLSPQGYDRIITNTMNASGFGQSDLGLGDINGDGYLDILVGSGGMQMEGANSGGAQVVFGGGELPDKIDLATYSHVNVTSYPGYYLSQMTSADINGDGIDDLITCAPYGFSDMSGGIFAFYGDELFPTGHLSIMDNDFMIRGPFPEYEFNVESAGDINKDGRDDLWIRSFYGPGASEIGQYYLLYMNQTDDLPDPSVYYMKFETPDFKVVAANDETSFGYYSKNNLITMDYDGDGLLEVIAADYDGSVLGGPDESGAIYIYYQQKSEIRILDFNIQGLDGPDENVVCAGKVYNIYSHVENTWSLDDFRTLDLSFVFHGTEVEGERLRFFWDRGLMVMAPRQDNKDWFDIESSAFVPDGADGFHIYFNFSLRSNIPSEEPVDIVLEVSGGLSTFMSISYPAKFKVEPDVSFLGNLTVRGNINGELNKGSYVQPGERIDVTGMRVVYEGTDASPPDDYFAVRMMDNFGNVFLNTSSSGMDILFTYRTQELEGREEINVSIIDLVGEADDMSGLQSFFYLVDADLPDPPEDLEIRADSDIDTLMGFDNDPDVYVSWSPAFDTTSEVIGYMYNVIDGGGTGEGWFTTNTAVEFQGLQEGWNTIYVWSVDSAHNYGPSTSASVFYDVNDPVFGVPNPGPGSWVNTNTVNYELTLFDRGGSGIRGSTVEYSLSYDGGVSFSSWEPTNLRRDSDQLTVKLFLNFREGADNFVKWRVKDVSGNGYVESSPFQVKVDTVPLTYKTPSPIEPVDDNYVECAITLTDGKGSGVDARTIQYSISHNGVSNYGPWETLDLSGSYSDIEVSTPPIFFERDTVNYIRWRAMDLAGNGYTYSPDIPIRVMKEKINSDPVPIITSPVESVGYTVAQKITFDGSTSLDPDGDGMRYLWYSDRDGYLGTDPVISKYLSQGNHLITLHVSDGLSNTSISVSIKVIPDINNLDTDKDGIPDITDPDDDNDGLLDIVEDSNRDGLFNGNETDQKNPDTDGDGVNDLRDPAPRDPMVTEVKDETTVAAWIFVIMVALIIIALAVFGVVFYLKQRTDKEKQAARRDLRKTRRNLKRFEVLTGVPTNDLPAIEAIQWALPGVINEASDFVLESPPSDDLLPSGDDVVSLEEEGEKPVLDDLEVPAPSDAVSGPEPPESPESPDVSDVSPASASGNVHNCPLCGSEVVVPDGASQAECPLCGEIMTV